MLVRVGVLCLVLVLLFSTLCHFSFAIILMGKRSSCFSLTVFPMSCDSQCSVNLTHGAVGWFEVCDCGIVLALFGDDLPGSVQLVAPGSL